MSVRIEQLKAPSLTEPENTGEIEPAWFPEGTVDVYLQAYISDGVARAASLPEGEQDAAVIAWAYYRAFKAIHLRFSSDPSEWTFDSGRTRGKFTAEQIAEFAT